MTAPRGAPPIRSALGAWCLVLLAAGLEVVWALAIAAAGGLARPAWALAGFVVAIISLAMLTLALRTLPLGSAYAVWVGLGAVGVAIAGVALLGESVTPLQASCLALVVAGAIGLAVTDSPTGRRE